MKPLKLFLSLAVLSVTSLAAADFEVIANKSLGDAGISSSDLKLIFLETKTSVGGTHVEPVLASAGGAHELFLAYLGKSDSGLKNYYKSLLFSGKGSMPKAFATDAEIIAYVSKTKGAIGYVTAGSATPDVSKIALK